MQERDNQEIRFAICITGSEPDLEIRKVYEVLVDESAAGSNHLRIIDESGDDYLYPASFFVMIELPQEAERALLSPS